MTMTKGKSWSHIGAAALVMIACAVPEQHLRAQTATATLEGTVTDPTGTAMSGAFVQAQNAATGLERTTVSNDRGFYSLSSLPVGDYVLTLEKPGFQKKVMEGIALEVDQIARFDVRLEIGSQSTVVTVRAQAPLVNTANAAIGDVIENRRVEDLPLNGRFFLQLSLLAGGSAPSPQGGAHQQWATNSGGFGFSVAGQRETQNNFLLDGVTVEEQFINTLSVCPSIDAIREFQVLESSYSAEGGIFSGAQINVTTKSGTNDFHGTLYEFLRNDKLDARNFFDDPTQPQPEYRQNQFGGSLGGPLVKNRTFFFANYEGFRIRQAITNRSLLPTQELRSGNLSGIDPATGKPFPTITDPATGKPFPGNLIPPERFDPLSAAILNLIPLPSQPALTGLNSTDIGLRYEYADESIVRLDHQFSQRQQSFARFAWQNDFQNLPFVHNGFASNPPAPPGFGDINNSEGRNLALGLTSTLAPNRVNEFRFGFNKFGGTKESQNIDSRFVQKLGFQRGGPAINYGIPAISIPGFADIGDPDVFQPIDRFSEDFQFVDNLSWVAGRHSQKFGVDYRRIHRRDNVEDFSQGLFLFNDGFTSVTGSAFSDFLLGRPFLSFSFAGSSIGWDRSNYLGLYYNDEVHATSRFTVNLGLRYEFNQSPADRFGQQSIANPLNSNQFFVRTPNGQLPAQVNDPLNQLWVKAFGFQFLPASSAGLPPALVHTDYGNVGGNFAPRIGLAWDVAGDGKTVVRSGYGIYNAVGQQDFAIETRQSPPFVSFPFGVDLARFFVPVPPLTYQQGFLAGNMAPQFLSTLPDLHNAYVDEWTFDVQRVITPNTILDAGYIGSTGVKLTGRFVGNQPLPNLPGARRGQSPFPGQEYFSRASDNSASYNALVLRVERRFSRGLSLVGAYTWSKSLDTSSTLQGMSTVPQNSYDLSGERGRSDFDTPHRFVLSSIWALPFGPGKRWANAGWRSHLLDGWQIANIVTLEAGQPTTAHLSTSLNGTGNNAAGSARPDLIGNPNLPASQRGPAHWFNTAAFAEPPTFTDAGGPYQIPGNEGRNVISGPPLNDWDASLQKVTSLTEKQRITIRADMFNLTNHPNFDLPNTTFGTASFGSITSARDPRIIQFALRYSF